MYKRSLKNRLSKNRARWKKMDPIEIPETTQPVPNLDSSEEQFTATRRERSS